MRYALCIFDALRHRGSSDIISKVRNDIIFSSGSSGSSLFRGSLPCYHPWITEGHLHSFACGSLGINIFHAEAKFSTGSTSGNFIQSSRIHNKGKVVGITPRFLALRDDI